MNVAENERSRWKRRWEKGKESLVKERPRESQTDVKEKDIDQQIHILTHIAKKRDKKMSKNHNLKMRKGKI